MCIKNTAQPNYRRNTLKMKESLTVLDCGKENEYYLKMVFCFFFCAPELTDYTFNVCL